MAYLNCVNEDGSIDFEQLALNVASDYCASSASSAITNDWDDSPFNRVMDWRLYVPTSVEEVWNDLPIWLRMIFYSMAVHEANQEEWD